MYVTYKWKSDDDQINTYSVNGSHIPRIGDTVHIKEFNIGGYVISVEWTINKTKTMDLEIYINRTY